MAQLIDHDGVVRFDGTLEGGAVQVASVSLTSAQLLALNDPDFPVELLPAPGGRRYYVLHSLVLHYRFVTTPYNEAVAGKLLVGYSPAAGMIAAGQACDPCKGAGNQFTPADLFKQTEDAYVITEVAGTQAPYFGWLAGTVEDKAMVLTLLDGGVLTGGDGTLTVRVFYSLIDGAPA